MDDWGNHWADRGASGDIGAFQAEQVAPEWIRTKASHILRNAVRDGEWYIGDAQGTPIAINGIMDWLHDHRFNSYTVHRDSVRDGPPRWVDSTTILAAKVYNGAKPSVAKAAQTSRIIFNKHWHGGNRAKQKYASEEDAIEDCKCHMCGGDDS